MENLYPISRIELQSQRANSCRSESVRPSAELPILLRQTIRDFPGGAIDSNNQPIDTGRMG